jgi:hypothetical protein
MQLDVCDPQYISLAFVLRRRHSLCLIKYVHHESVKVLELFLEHIPKLRHIAFPAFDRDVRREGYHSVDAAYALPNDVLHLRMTHETIACP